jgi:hypothetical protein
MLIEQILPRKQGGVGERVLLQRLLVVSIVVKLRFICKLFRRYTTIRCRNSAVAVFARGAEVGGGYNGLIIPHRRLTVLLLLEI